MLVSEVPKADSTAVLSALVIFRDIRCPILDGRRGFAITERQVVIGQPFPHWVSREVVPIIGLAVNSRCRRGEGIWPGPPSYLNCGMTDEAADCDIGQR